MSGPVDVLADLRGVIRIAKAVSVGVTGNGPRIERAEAALAAVAELVEAAQVPAVAYGCLSSTGVHFVSDDRDHCVEESRRDGSLVVELIMRPRAALAKFEVQS